MFKVDIELTSHCNAKCPFCIREDVVFEPKHLDFDVIKKLPFEKIDRILILGNKGDGIFYPQLFELIEYIKNFNTYIALHTNASAYNEKWWTKLGVLLKGDHDVVYALDGLEDTHSIHRVGTDFNKIVRNMKTYGRTGAKSICQFLLFKHNEHQVEAVKKLSLEIGSHEFWLRHSRKYNNELQRPTTGTKTRHELNSECKGEVICPFLETPQFYVTVDGEIRPCCFMADDDYENDKVLIRDIRHSQHILSYRKHPEQINLNHYTFDEIMESDYYKWLKKNYKYIKRCNNRCKVTFEDIVDRL